MRPDPRAVALLERELSPDEFDRRLARLRAEQAADPSTAELIAWFDEGFG